MPRQSRGSAPRRPSAPAAAPRAPQQQQQRTATTSAAYPPATRGGNVPQTQTQSGGGGLFGQMASTAAGVAVGSSIGHAIGGFFGGGSAPASSVGQDGLAQSQDMYAQPQQSQQQENVCGPRVQEFRKCLDDNQGDMQICGWYLDQLKACQAAAAPY